MSGRRNKPNPYKRPDVHTRAAKQQGFPARSVFKLEEIDRRVRLFRPGQRVLDLGAAPGSWSMYAAQKVGPSGAVLAVDLQPILVALPKSSEAIVGDALSLENASLARFAPYDVILSDMAPATTGSRFADQARSFELFMRALEVAKALLAPSGAFVGKLFMSDDFKTAREAMRLLFDDVRVIRPEGTRTTSFEVFLCGLGRKSEPAEPGDKA